MRMIRLVSLCLFLLLLGGQGLLADTVYAMCCGCSSCWLPWCSCPGKNGCAWYACRTADTDKIQASAPSDPIAISMKLARDADGMVYLRQLSECTRAKFALRLLGDAAEDLKPVGLGADLRVDFATQVAASMDQ